MLKQLLRGQKADIRSDDLLCSLGANEGVAGQREQLVAYKYGVTVLCCCLRARALQAGLCSALKKDARVIPACCSCDPGMQPVLL